MVCPLHMYGTYVEVNVQLEQNKIISGNFYNHSLTILTTIQLSDAIYLGICVIYPVLINVHARTYYDISQVANIIRKSQIENVQYHIVIRS